MVAAAASITAIANATVLTLGGLGLSGPVGLTPPSPCGVDCNYRGFLLGEGAHDFARRLVLELA